MRSGSIRPPGGNLKPGSELSEVFSAARILAANSVNFLINLFGYALGIGEAPEEIRVWRSRIRERVGCAEPIERGEVAHCDVGPFFFVSITVLRNGKGNMCGSKWTGVAIDRRIGGRHRCCFIYALSWFCWLASIVSCERERVVKSSPLLAHPSCFF